MKKYAIIATARKKGLEKGESLLVEKYDLSILSNKYNEALISVKDRFDFLQNELSIYGDKNPIEYINYRVKEPKSIVEKLYRLSIPFSLENVESTLTDIIGVRIVCPFLDDLDMVIQIIKKMEEAGELKIKIVKDYVNKPKDSGYSSYHIIVEMPVKIINHRESTVHIVRDSVRMLRDLLKIRKSVNKAFKSMSKITRD